MAKYRIRPFYSGGKRRYKIERLTLLGWCWSENGRSILISFSTRQEADTFLRKYKSIKRR